MLDAAIMRRAVGDSFVKLDPRHLMRNPVMFVVEVGSVLTTILFFTNLGVGEHRRERVRRARRRRCSGSRCCSRTSPRRSPKAAARRRPTRCARPVRDDGEPPRAPTGRSRRSPGTQLDLGDEVRGRRGRGHPERRRRRRGHREHRRVGDHRRVGPGDPRGRWRPLGGHRRDAGALRPDRRAHHRPTGRDVHRPDDRAGRGIRAAEDAERDRAQHPARRADDHLPARRP